VFPAKRHFLFSALLIGLLAGTVRAADFEFVPFLGYRFGGGLEDLDTQQTNEFNEGADWGIILGRTAGENRRYELLYSQQETRLADTTDPNNAFDMKVHYLHLGGTVDISRNQFIPYVSGGLGVMHLHPSGSGLDDETRFSLSLGGGLKWYPTDSLGLRFEVRGYGTLTEGEGRLFCDSGCNLRFSGDMMSQFETNLGLIFRF
jgi:opacity protein-like surface antigen